MSSGAGARVVAGAVAGHVRGGVLLLLPLLLSSSSIESLVAKSGLLITACYIFSTLNEALLNGSLERRLKD